jgi:hypothetical protein
MLLEKTCFRKACFRKKGAALRNPIVHRDGWPSSASELPESLDDAVQEESVHQDRGNVQGGIT